jgi:RNA polymerase sigma factor (sigma-70 family)
MTGAGQLLQLARSGHPATTDGDLLHRYARERDEAAFAEVVRRNGPLVLRVCRSVLGEATAAEDAFQATFLLLARRASRLTSPGSLSGWLHAAAVRIARDARVAGARARRREVARPSSPVAPDDLTWREVRELLDAELAALPERYRAPLVLCYLQEMSYEEAARSAGCSVGALRGRLERGKERLRKRLVRHGLPLAAPALVLGPPAPVSAALAAATLLTVRTAASGGRVPAAVAALAGPRVGLKAVLLAPAAIGLVLSAVLAGIGHPTTDPPVADPPRPTTREAPGGPALRSDLFGDPLPAGAVMRLGSERWRHEGEARSMSFAPDGKTLAVLSGEDGATTFFDAATGRLVGRLDPTEDGTPEEIGFSPDGKVFACKLAGGTVQVRDAKTLKVIRTLALPEAGGPGDGSGVERPICFSPDGTRLAVNTGQATVAVWDVGQGKLSAVLKGHKHGNPALAFSPDGKVVFLGGVDPPVQLWDAATGKFLRGFETGASAFSLTVSADGKVVASGGRDRIIVTAVETGKELARLSAEKMGAVLGLGFTPDGAALISWGEDAKVRVWDVATGKERRALDSRGWIGRTMALSADGKTVAAGTVFNVVRAWDVATGKELSAQAEGHDAPLHAIAYSPGGRHLVTGGANHHVQLWDAATGRPGKRLDGHRASQVAFSPDGRLLASAWESDQRARVRDLERGVELYALPHDVAARVPAIAFTPDGKSVLTVSWRWNGEKPRPDTPRCTGLLRLWDPATGKAVRAAPLPGVGDTVLAVSPGGGVAAVGGWGEAPLWLCDLTAGRERRLPQEPWDTVKAVAFSPDGRVLATGGVDRENVLTNRRRNRRVRLWEVATGREIVALSGHERTVTAAAFAPGGRVLATADGGDTFRGVPVGERVILFWDTATGKELVRLGGHASDVTALAFSPDGTRLAGALKNGTALVWAVPPTAKPAAGGRLDQRELAALWADLAGAPGLAHAAVRALADAPEQSALFLASALRPAAKPDVAKLRARISDLGAEDFKVREAASEELARLGEGAEPELLRARKGDPSPEAARRVEALLSALRAGPPPERRRELRAVWALELGGTPAAEKVLAALAEGDPDARLTRAAAAALGRLRGRK